MMLIAKIHKKEDRTVIAVCDNSLVGTRIEDGTALLDLDSDFYKGEEYDEKTVGDLMRNADAVNLVGPVAVRIGVEEGIIDEKNIKKLKAVPYAQAVVVHD